MQVLLDGLSVLRLDWLGISIYLISALGLGVWAIDFLLVDGHNDFALKLIAGLSLGSLVLVLPALILLILERFSPLLARTGGFLLVLLSLVALYKGLHHTKFPDPKALSLFFLFLSGLLLIRLAFLQEMLLPPYDDAPEHYAIVQDLLYPNSGTHTFYSIETITVHYYHFGFHVLAAWVSLVSGINAAQAIALLGQLFLVLFPLSVFFLAYIVTDRMLAGWIAAVFAAFAWRMPAFSANWAKYPAMAGLALLPVVMGLWLLYWGSPVRKNKVLVILIVIILALIFIHTRLVICLLLMLVSVLLARILPIHRNPYFWETCILAALVIGIFLALGGTLFVFYGNGYFLSLGLTVILLPFSFYRFQRFTVGISLFMLGVWIASRISVPMETLGPAWLDQPFVEILLSIPLSLLAATGLIGLLDQVQRPMLRWAIIVIAIAVVVTGFLTANSLRPDHCCDYVKDGDVQAIQWIGANTPQDAVVWIPAIKSRTYLVGMDAGVWINALTGRNSNKLRYDFAWDTSGALSRICRAGYEHIYIYEGGRIYSFDDTRLAEQDWVRPVFEINSIKVYQVLDACIP